jgi:hypothetical protein
MAVYRLEKDVGSKDEDNLPLLTSLKMALSDYRVSSHILAHVEAGPLRRRR